MEKTFNKDGTITIKMTELEYFNSQFGEQKQSLSAEINLVPQSQDLESEITKVLHEIGVPAHIKGFRYLRESIQMVAGSPSSIDFVTKGIYIDIAKGHDDTPTRVERAIRHAIEKGFSRITPDMIVKYFDGMDYIKGKPCNSEFIATIADTLRLRRKGL